MSKTYNLVGGGNVEKAVLVVTVTNGTPTSVTATKTGGSVSLVHDSTNDIWTGNVAPGTWTVTATDGTNSGSISVTVDTVRVYSVIVGMSELGGDYTKLEYVQGIANQASSNVVSGIYPISNNRITGETQIVALGTGNGDMMWVWDDSPAIHIVWRATESYFIYRLNTTNLDIKAVDTNKHTYNIRGKTINVDGTNYTNTSSSTVTTNPEAVTHLVCSNTTGWVVRHYWFKIYNTSDTEVICDLIPAIRNSDLAVGMYDKARNIFLAFNNAIAGPAV